MVAANGLTPHHGATRRRLAGARAGARSHRRGGFASPLARSRAAGSARTGRWWPQTGSPPTTAPLGAGSLALALARAHIGGEASPPPSPVRGPPEVHGLGDGGRKRAHPPPRRHSAPARWRSRWRALT